MQESYPEATIRENLEQGVWPVPSHSSNRYWSIADDVRSALQSETESIPSQLRILDVGASFGDPLAEFAQALRSQSEWSIETIALDVNPYAVHNARQRENADIAIQAMAQQVPLAAESVDIVIAKRLLAFLNPADQSQSLCEIERVLAPAGVAVVELDPVGTRSLDVSCLWILSARTLCHLRCTTDDFTAYPFPSPPEERTEGKQ